MANPTSEMFSNIFGAYKKDIDETMKKILSLINAEEKVIKSSGDSNDEPNLGSLVNDFYDRYQALYSRYDELIWKLKKNFHNKRETGSFSLDITPTDTEGSFSLDITSTDIEHSDLKIHSSSSSAAEHNKICEGKLGEDACMFDDQPETEVDSNKGGKNSAKREEDLQRRIVALCQLLGELNKSIRTLTAENEDLKYEKSLALNKLDEKERHLQECKDENERLIQENSELVDDEGELEKELRLEELIHNLGLNCAEMQTKSEPLSNEDQIQELTEKASSLKLSKAVGLVQLQVCKQVLSGEVKGIFESEFMKACKNLVNSLQKISVITSLFEEDRQFEDQFLEICKNVVFSLEKIKVSDQQHQTIRELQKACQDQKIEISKLVERHKEMSEKIEACEAKKEGDDKEIKELRGQVQTLEEELCRCNQRLKNTEAEYEEKEDNLRSVEDYLRMKCKHLEAQRSEKRMMKIKDLLRVQIVGTLDDICNQMDSAVKEKCRQFQTKLSKSSEELQRMRKRLAALGYEKQQQDHEARRVQEKCRHILTNLSKSSEELQRVKKRSATLGCEKQDQEAIRRMQEEMEELEKRIREKEEEEEGLVREEMGELKKRLAEEEEDGRRMQEEMGELEKRIREKEEEEGLVREEMRELKKRVAETEEEGRRMYLEMEELQKRVRENDKEGILVEEEMGELEQRLREVGEKIREDEEGGIRMERSAAHDMMMLEQLEKSIDDKIAESKVLREGMEEREKKLREEEEQGRRRQEEMEKLERRLREKEEEVKRKQEEMEEREKSMSTEKRRKRRCWL